MISKTRRTVWNNLSSHHDPAGRERRQFLWLRATKSSHSDHGEHPDSHEAHATYPADVLKSFEAAIKRCPSVSMDADIMEGQPCIAGTRIPVSAILRVIEHYGGVKDVKACYPQLTSNQVEDALYFSQVILELPSGLDKTALAT